MAKKHRKERSLAKEESAANEQSAPKVYSVPTRRYRDALTGRFVTKKYAKKNRKTTVKEAIA